MSRVTVRPAVEADFVAFGRALPPARVQAWAAENEAGELVGLGGIIRVPGGLPVAFVDVRGDARCAYALSLHRAGLRFIAGMRRQGVRRMRALAEDRVEAADRWLMRLGFGLISDDQGMRIYEWRR